METLVSCSQTLPEEWLLEKQPYIIVYFHRGGLGARLTLLPLTSAVLPVTLTAVPPDFFPLPLDDSAASAPPDPVVC